MSAIPEIACAVTREEPFPLPSLAPRGHFSIHIVASKEDLADLADLPGYGGALTWSYSESLRDLSQTSYFTLVIWSTSLGGLCEAPIQRDGMLLLYWAGDICPDDDFGYIYPRSKILASVRQSVLQLIPPLYLSCNYDGLLCVDVDDVYDLLRGGRELRLLGRQSGNLRHDIDDSVAWLCNERSDTAPVSATCLGLYLSCFWMRSAEASTMVNCRLLGA